MMKALFLDRDGTLIVNQHYLSDPEKVVLLPTVKETIRELYEKRVLLFLHSNQSGVGRGYFTLEQAIECNNRMIDLLGLSVNPFTSICMAPEHPDEPPTYRKPLVTFEQEMFEMHDLKPSECAFIGDTRVDAETAKNAGMQCALVDTGRDRLSEDSEFIRDYPNIPLTKTFAEAVQNVMGW